MYCAGEVHLETVIKDLKERFARIQLQVSPPLVAFRESVFLPSESPDAVVKPAKVIPSPDTLPSQLHTMLSTQQHATFLAAETPTLPRQQRQDRCFVDLRCYSQSSQGQQGTILPVLKRCCAWKQTNHAVLLLSWPSGQSLTVQLLHQ